MSEPENPSEELATPNKNISEVSRTLGALNLLPVPILIFGVFNLVGNGFGFEFSLITHVPVVLGLLHFFLSPHVGRAALGGEMSPIYPIAGLIVVVSCAYSVFYLGIWGVLSMFIGEDASFSILTTLRSVFFFYLGMYTINRASELTTRVSELRSD